MISLQSMMWIALDNDQAHRAFPRSRWASGAKHLRVLKRYVLGILGGLYDVLIFKHIFRWNPRWYKSTPKPNKDIYHIIEFLLWNLHTQLLWQPYTTPRLWCGQPSTPAPAPGILWTSCQAQCFSASGWFFAPLSWQLQHGNDRGPTRVIHKVGESFRA